jgi:alkyl hydroperoxide reductase subunit AhpC
MTLQLGDSAPNFGADTTQGRIDFHRWLGESWSVFFSHPRDFTPVCTTELGQLARLQSKFEQRDVKLLGLSIDTVQSHHQWAQDVRETHGVPIDFPIVSDLDRTVARLYGMLHPNDSDALTARAVLVIDPAKKIRLMLTYPQSCGRNFDELLRAIDSLQLSDAHNVITPADWRAGDDVIIPPSFTDEEAHQRFPRGWRALTPYLRLTPHPGVAMS